MFHYQWMGVEGMVSLMYCNVFTFKKFLRKASNLVSGSFSVFLMSHSACNINYSIKREGSKNAFNLGSVSSSESQRRRQKFTFLCCLFSFFLNKRKKCTRMPFATLLKSYFDLEDSINTYSHIPKPTFLLGDGFVIPHE